MYNIHIYIHTYIHTYIYIHVFMYTYICIHVFMYTYICIYIYIRAIQLTYTHMDFIFSMMKEPAILVQSFVYPTTIWNLPFLYSCYLLIYTCVYIYIYGLSVLKYRKCMVWNVMKKTLRMEVEVVFINDCSRVATCCTISLPSSPNLRFKKSSSHFITTLVV